MLHHAGEQERPATVPRQTVRVLPLKMVRRGGGLIYILWGERLALMCIQVTPFIYIYLYLFIYIYIYLSTARPPLIWLMLL